MINDFVECIVFDWAKLGYRFAVTVKCRNPKLIVCPDGCYSIGSKSRLLPSHISTRNEPIAKLDLCIPYNYGLNNHVHKWVLVTIN